jgi:hypothetical protein
MHIDPGRIPAVYQTWSNTSRVVRSCIHNYCNPSSASEISDLVNESEKSLLCYPKQIYCLSFWISGAAAGIELGMREGSLQIVLSSTKMLYHLGRRWAELSLPGLTSLNRVLQTSTGQASKALQQNLHQGQTSNLGLSKASFRK